MVSSPPEQNIDSVEIALGIKFFFSVNILKTDDKQPKTLLIK